jgi:toxin ParE1/3/4
MSLPVRLLSAVDTDLAQQAAFLQESSEASAIRFLDSFDATLASIGAFPLSGLPRRSPNPFLSGLRFCRVKDFPNHLIFYLVREQEVVVIRIVHGARDLDALFGPEGEP